MCPPCFPRFRFELVLEFEPVSTAVLGQKLRLTIDNKYASFWIILRFVGKLLHDRRRCHAVGKRMLPGDGSARSSPRAPRDSQHA